MLSLDPRAGAASRVDSRDRYCSPDSDFEKTNNPSIEVRGTEQP